MSPRDSYYPVVLVFVVLDSIAVALRLWVRHVKSAIGYDDLALAVSLVCSQCQRNITEHGKSLRP